MWPRAIEELIRLGLYAHLLQQEGQFIGQFLVELLPGGTHTMTSLKLNTKQYRIIQLLFWGRTTGRIPGISPAWEVQDDDVQEPQKPRVGVRFIELVERIVTVNLLIVLLAIAVMVVLAEVSGTGNTVIVRLVHVDIRYEIAYLLSLVRQLHFQ